MRLEVLGEKNREDGKRCQTNVYHCSTWFLITHQHAYVNSRIRHQPCLLKCPWWPFLAQFPLSFWLCLVLVYCQNNLDLSLTPCLTLTHLSPPPETWGVQQLFSHRRKLGSDHSFHNAFVVKKKKKRKKSNDVLSYLSDMAKEGTVSVASESHGYLGADMWSTLLIHSLTLRMPKELTCAMRVTTYRWLSADGFRQKWALNWRNWQTSNSQFPWWILSQVSTECCGRTAPKCNYGSKFNTDQGLHWT